MNETIKPVINCPTCGAECKVGGEETHYYIPQYTYSEDEVVYLLKDFGLHVLLKEVRGENLSARNWFNEHKKNRL